jgi:hypothetical protein
MKSSKQRRLEIKAKRRAKADKHQIDTRISLDKLPEGAVEANQLELAHNNTFGSLPKFYIDVPFSCIECGAPDIWTAKSQKWFYEIAKGSIFATASRCGACRKKRREAKQDQKNHMEAMAKKEPHPNEQFFKNK